MAFTQLLMIFLGGGLGATARFALASFVNAKTANPDSVDFPWGIFFCNLLGCLLIGCSYGWLKAHHPEWIHPLFVTGLFGGFTTFSTFTLDTQILIQNQAYLSAGLYALGTLLLGLLLCVTGYQITNQL